MRIFVLYHGRFPSEKAASLFAAQEAASFGMIGVETALVVPRRLGRIREEAHRYYSLPETFAVTFLPTLDIFWFRFAGRFAQRVSDVVFSLCALVYLAVRVRRGDWVVSNEALPLVCASLVSQNTLYEVHDFPENKWPHTSVLRRARRILATNEWKAGELAKRYKIGTDRMFVESNAAHAAVFDLPLSREEAREKLGLPRDGRFAVYTGHLYEWKGVSTLARAAELMPEVAVYVVGGTDYDLGRFRAKFGHLKNLHIVGHRAHSEMPLWQRAADVLVLPNTATEEISSHHTSPMKLFEYMASGTPVVASDLPSIAGIARGRAVLVKPDDPASLSAGITHVLTDGAEDEAAEARAWVQDHTWQKRAKRILEKLQARQ